MDDKSALVYMMREQTINQATDAAALRRMRPKSTRQFHCTNGISFYY